jgi:hypothetical protein
MATLSNPPSKCAIISCDPGNEIDDELFINWAIKNMHGFLIYIMCVPGCESTNPEDSPKIIQERINHLISVFPNFKFNSELNKYYFVNKYCKFIVTGPNILSELSSIPGKNYNKNNKTVIDLFIDIAPSWHIDPILFLNFEFGRRIVMGDLNNPSKSINLTKAIPKDNTELLLEYSLQEANIFAHDTTVITTTFARQVPIPFYHIENLPDNLKIPLKNKSFEQFVGRPPAHLVWSKDISIANFKTITNMFPKNDPSLDDILNNEGKTTFEESDLVQLKNFITLFLNNAPEMSDAEYIDYYERLYCISLCVMHITNCHYTKPEFNMASLNDPDLAKENWEIFNQTFHCDSTPAYDLLAAVAILNPSYLGNVEKCQELINSM